MILRRVKLQVLAFVVISLLGVAFVGFRYVGIGGALFNDSYSISAEFADSGGIFSGAEVTYRGVTVGKVGKLQLRPDGVRVQLHIDGNSTIPRDTRAVVANRSAVGEQYVDLRPETSAGPYLRAGNVIPKSRTSTPLPVETLLVNIDRLVNSVDRDDLATVIDELGKAFAGGGQDLQRLLDAGDALLASADANIQQTIALIRDGKTVLETQNATSSEIKRFAAGLASLSDQLRKSDPDIRRLLSDGPGAAGELDSLLTGLRPTLGVLLSNLIVVGNVQGRRLPGLEQILVSYPAVANGGFTVVRFDPATGEWTSHFGLALNNDPHACQAAYKPGARPANCTPAELAAGSGVRSSARAPRPGGSDPPPPAGAGAPVGPSPAATTASPPGGYDSGVPDLTAGSTGGQQRLFGDQSWKWLLVGPLTG